MAITQLQQRGLENCPDFREQVLSIVEYQTLEYVRQYKDSLDDSQRALLSRVQQEPERYGFVSTILHDGDWALTFDAWEADIQAAGSAILTSVKVWYSFCTGFVEPAAP